MAIIPPPDDDLQSALDLFFKPPHAAPFEGWTSTLFLCRKELQDCLIGKVVPERDLLAHEHFRLFATAMVAMAGFELVAQMTPSPPSSQGRRGMFIHVVTTFASVEGSKLSPEDAAMLWNFRNALSHTFGLFHMDETGAAVPIYLYDQNSPAPVVRKLEGSGGADIAWEICLDGIVEAFLHTVDAFEKHVRSNPDSQGHFLDAFKKYGRLYHRGVHVSRTGKLIGKGSPIDVTSWPPTNPASINR